MPLSQPQIHRHNGRTPGNSLVVQPSGSPSFPYGDSYTYDYYAATSGNAPIYRDDGTGNIYLECQNASASSQINEYLPNDSKFLQFNFEFRIVQHVTAAVLLVQHRTATATVFNSLFQISNGITTFRTRGVSDGNLVNNFAVPLDLNTTYITRVIAHSGTNGGSDGKIRSQLIRKSDMAVIYDQENTTQAMNGVNWRILNFGKFNTSTNSLQIDNVQSFDNAYEFLPVLSDFANISVNAGADQNNVEPFDTVNLVATAAGGVPTSWNWTQISGPTVALSGTGASRTFVAPALAEGATLAFSVTGTAAGSTSPADEVVVTVLPHNNFKAIGGSWTGVRFNRLSV